LDAITDTNPKQYTKLITKSNKNSYSDTYTNSDTKSTYTNTECYSVSIM
jgi:hypothetical protein